MADLAAFQETLGMAFRDQSLLEQALVHSSYVNENPGVTADGNERLEFLGDAVLGLVIAEKLYGDYPGLAEGEMTRIRSALVRRETLARVARTISLGNYLYLGRGEETTGGRRKPANLAGAMEAILAAVYLDQGLKTARDLILELFAGELGDATSQGAGADYKSRLQEIVQSRWQVLPRYRLAESTGPDHAPWFTVEVLMADTVLGRGSGKSKKLAETEAARLALERLAADFTH